MEVSYQVRIAGDVSSGGQGQLIDGAKVLASQGESVDHYERDLVNTLHNPFLCPCTVEVPALHFTTSGCDYPPCALPSILLYSKGSRPSDDSIYFVLGPANSNAPSSYSSGTALPTGWDASVRGMCVGERRLITLPAKLAYGKEGLELKKEMGKPAAIRIPPNSALLIDVRLLSLNGVA